MRTHPWENVVRVLLVEDNAADARLIQALLKQCMTPFEIDVVTDGEAALDYLMQREPYSAAVRPDLILLDLNLPRRSGKEVLAEVKAHPTLRSIPAIVLSTSSSEDDISKAYELHANSFVTKPSELQEFITAIKNIESFWMGTARLPRRYGQEAVTSAGWDCSL